jgi:hypothetical protein
MARREELLISKSMILRSVRALSTSPPLSDFPGLIGLDKCGLLGLIDIGKCGTPGLMGIWGSGSLEIEEPLLKTRGRRVGICSDIMGGVFSELKVLDTMIGLALRPSYVPWLEEPILEDFRCRGSGREGDCCRSG